MVRATNDELDGPTHGGESKHGAQSRRIPCEFTLERMDACEVVDDQRYNPRLLHQIVVQQVKARNPGFTRLNWAVFF